MANFNKKSARSFSIERSKIDVEKRTVELAFSSETPVERWGENEVLSHDKNDYDFDRLNNAHPLLLGHDEWDPRSQIGVVESARVDSDKVGRAIVRFGDSELATEIFNDVQKGIRKLVSVGYDRTGIVSSSKDANGMMTTRYRWMPTHIAIVTVPADTAVGVGRGKRDPGDASTCTACGSAVDPDKDGQTCPGCGAQTNSGASLNVEQLAKQLTPEQKRAMKILLDPNPAAGGGGTTTATAPTPAETEARAKKAGDDALKADRERRQKIRTAGDLIIKDRPDTAELVRNIVNESCEGEVSIGEFQIRAMQEVIKAKPAKQITLASLGCNERQAGEYSIVRGIQSCIKRESRTPDGFEGEIHQEMSKRDLGFEPSGFVVPSDAGVSRRSLSRRDLMRSQRDLQVNVFGQGGATVATELLTPIIEILRNRMVTERLGVRVMAGLEGNVVIPRQTGAGTAYSVSEIAQLTLSTQILDQIALSPKRVGATGNYSKQLVLQSSIDVENFLRDDFLKVIAIDWDRLILNGQGSASEPLGIMNTPGVGSVLFGAAATYAKLVSFKTQVATANADVGEMAYVTTPTAEGVLRSAAKLLVGATTVAAMPLWDGPFGADSPDGIVAGFRAASTNQIPNNQMLFGVFSEVIHALWGGYDVVVDPFTLADKAEVKLTINTWGDVAIRHPQCFAVSPDSAAQ